MTESDAIIVGGGPAGSTCAWKLLEAGRSVIVLDKQEFPRTKPCAGWITPRVLRDLRLNAQEYPYTLERFDALHFHFGSRRVPFPTLQYAIRRVEFDAWLLRRSAVTVHQHAVTDIRKEGAAYVVDDAYRCRYLVGAGGTNCPVYRTFFRNVRPRVLELQITAMEDEVPSRPLQKGCHLWFAREVPGYSWYVPKGDAALNVGVGGKSRSIETRAKNIHQYWDDLVERLRAASYLAGEPLRPRGYVYYLRHDSGPVQIESAYLVGDAAGLATRDLGEGIGPAVRSGILAAEAIVSGKRYSISSIPTYSAYDILFPRFRARIHRPSFDAARA